MDVAKLKIIQYPDPRLKKKSKPVVNFDPDLAALAQRMFELMREEEGVGLAAPQVGVNLRLFVMNHTGQPEDDRVVINPVLTALDGELENEEGCLSIPGVRVNVLRADQMKLEAVNLAGETFEREANDLESRVWQHETDHLDGILLIDRMSFTEKMRFRKKLKELEGKFKA
ncbi:MAG TPA: peptide deformylase [Tepidisphaeraceae bacterium]|nr:peptide deformylase [Tepidisphaeraceae bacterium]